MEQFEDVDAYLAAAQRWPDEIRAVRPLLLDAGLDETIKWGKPTYVHEGANVAVVQEFVDALAVLLPKGVLLDDPEGLLERVGPHSHAGRRVMLRSVAEVERHADALRALLAAAITVEDAGTPLPPRPEEPLADELAERLAANTAFADAFEGLTPGRQREYNLHVSGAKQAATRERRVEAIVPRVLDGRGLRDR